MQLQETALGNVIHIQPVADLPFTNFSETTRDWWCVQETGDWAEDNATGRHYATLAIRYIRRHKAQPVLGYIVSAMTQKRRAAEKPLGPIEVGFLGAIASALL